MQDLTNTLHELEEGDTLTTNTHTQELTVTETMFNGEIVELEGPQGGEKSLVENVNTGSIAILSGGDKLGTVTEINA